jgi:N-alpha-acetyl-L-2,4-diaminobutyrate deacetylase
MPDDRCYVTSDVTGLIEYCAELGDELRAGQVIARVHDTENTGRPPRDYRTEIAGVFAGRHFPGLIRPGDFLAMVAVPTA